LKNLLARICNPC